MCVISQTDKLIAAVLRINSPFKNFGNLVPKIIYHTDSDDDASGIFYDPDRNQLMYANFENGELLDSYDVVPTHIERPDEHGNYAYSDDELMTMRECDYCGEADDLSGYVYFDAVNIDED